MHYIITTHIHGIVNIIQLFTYALTIPSSFNYSLLLSQFLLAFTIHLRIDQTQTQTQTQTQIQTQHLPNIAFSSPIIPATFITDA